MADDDLLERARALQQRAEAARADAAHLREQLGDRFQERATELGTAKDRALRQQDAANRAVTDADHTVTRLEKDLASYRKSLTKDEKALHRADGKGDDEAAESLEEHADAYRRMIAETEARLHTATLDAAEAREDAGVAARQAMEATLAYDEHYDAVGKAEKEIDKLEDQADLLHQAQLKLAEADIRFGGEIPADANVDEYVLGMAGLEGEAEELVRKAEAIEPDRGLIAVVVPGADDPGANLDPEAAQDALGLGAIADEMASGLLAGATGDAGALDEPEAAGPDDLDGGDDGSGDDGSGGDGSGDDGPGDDGSSGGGDGSGDDTASALEAVWETLEVGVSEAGDIWQGISDTDPLAGDPVDTGSLDDGSLDTGTLDIGIGDDGTVDDGTLDTGSLDDGF